MARVKRTQYARRADLRMTSLLAKLQAWQAHVAAQLARAVPKRSKSSEKLDKEHYRAHLTGTAVKLSYHHLLSSSKGVPDSASGVPMMHKPGFCCTTRVTQMLQALSKQRLMVLLTDPAKDEHRVSPICGLKALLPGPAGPS